MSEPLQGDTIRGVTLPSFRHLVRAVANFEVLFVLFMFAGVYKGSALLARVPVDLTLVLLGLSIFSGMWILLRRGVRLRRKTAVAACLYALLLAWILVSLLWTPGHAYAHRKALMILTTNSWALLGGLLIADRGRRRARRLFVAIIVFGSAISLEALFASRGGGLEQAELVFSGGYLGLGQVIGAAAAILVGYLLLEPLRPAWKLAGVAVWLVMLWGLTVSGGRGPLLTTVAIPLIPIAAALRPGALQGRRWLIWAPLVLLVAVVAIGPIVPKLGAIAGLRERATTLWRLQSFVTDPTGGGSIATRAELWAVALNEWRASPLIGRGLGSFPVLASIWDDRLYPHNIILELLVEGGLIAAVLFAALVVYCLCALGRWERLRTDPEKIIVLMLLVSVGLNAMKSGDLPDNRFLFSVIGLALLGPRRLTAPAAPLPQPDDGAAAIRP